MSKISYDSSIIFKKAAESVVKFNVEYSVENKITLAVTKKLFSASGFSFISSENVSLILTNKHVCSGGATAKYTITNQNGEQLQATFIRSDDFADICLLKLNSAMNSLPLAKRNASRGDRIITIGAPDGVFPVIVDGIISGYHNMDMKATKDDDDDEFEVHFRAQIISAPIYLGSSGSPVLNTNGEVVGIVFAVRGDKEHIAYIVPISEVQRFLDMKEYVYTN